MIITTNVSALNTGRILTSNNTNQAKSLVKLSSGLRINSASDDAAGLAISEKMRAQVRGLQMAVRNVEDGISLVKIGDGALQEMSNMLQRIRELSVQSASDTNTLSDREAMQKEVNKLISEINIESQNANFNGIPLFDGSHVGTYEYAYGLKNSPTVTPMDPAYIFANEIFTLNENTPIAAGANATRTSGAHSLDELETSGGTAPNFLPNFPLEGLFAIEVQEYGRDKVTAVIDFTNKNFIVKQGSSVTTTAFSSVLSGDFSRADFDNFFINAFTNPPDGDGQIATYDSLSGSFVVTGVGLGGSQSQVNIGKTFTDSELTSLGLSTANVKYANSSIFGASKSDSNPQSYYNISGKDASGNTLLLTGINDIPVTDEEMWAMIPGNTQFIFYIEEYQTWTSNANYPDGGYWSNPTKLVTRYYTKDQIGGNTLAEANANLAILAANDPDFTDFSIGMSHFVDRDGHVLITLSAPSSRDTTKYPESSPPGKYIQTSSWMSANLSAYSVMSSVTTSPEGTINTDYTVVKSDYPLKISDNVGTLTIRITNIPNSSSTKTATIVINFADNSIRDSTANGTVLANFTAFDESDTADMLAKLTDVLNLPAYQANTPRKFPPTSADTNDVLHYPMGIARVDSSGHLEIVLSERRLTLSISEKESDRPILLGSSYSKTEVDKPHILQIDATPPANVTIAPGEYSDIDDFITRNVAAFSPNYILRKDDSGTKIVIESVLKGTGVDVRNISFISPTPTDPPNLLNLIGFVGHVYNDPTWFQDGVTHPAKPVPPSGLWIQGGANSGNGLFIYMPRLDAYDLGLMITLLDYADPNGSHRALGGVNGDHSIAGTGGVNMGTASYTTDANIEPIPMGFGLDITTREKASAAITIIDNAIKIISTERAQLGASQNRLEYMSQNIDISSENQTAAESRIRDIDMAKEMTKFTKLNILSQSTMAMLAQANSQPQRVLQLL